MTPFYGWGSTISLLLSHYEDSLLFATKSPGVSGSHFINPGRMKD